MQLRYGWLILGLWAGAALAQVPRVAQAPRVAPVPSPVPPEVAMPRPNESEVAAARAGLDKALARDDATRALAGKYPGLLEVRPPVINSAIVPQLTPQFQMKHQDNLAVAARGGIELLLMGDSITDFWRNADGPYAGKAVLDAHFGQWKIANFGIAGDTTQGVLYRLQDGEGRGFSPRAIMLMIGTNNTARNTAGEIAEGIGAVVLELKKDFPQAKILLLAVFPRGRPTDPVRGVIADINKRIAKLDDGKRVHYLDIGAKFLEPDGTISPEVMSDGLHPGPKGYEIWASAVKEQLTRLMQ